MMNSLLAVGWESFRANSTMQRRRDKNRIKASLESNKIQNNQGKKSLKNLKSRRLLRLRPRNEGDSESGLYLQHGAWLGNGTPGNKRLRCWFAIMGEKRPLRIHRTFPLAEYRDRRLIWEIFLVSKCSNPARLIISRG